MVASIDAMIAKVEGLKEKVCPNTPRGYVISPCPLQLDRLNEKSGNPTLFALQKRVDHVQELENFTTTDSPEFAKWSDTRLDRWLVDWALRTNKPETAKSLARAKEIEVGV